MQREVLVVDGGGEASELVSRLAASGRHIIGVDYEHAEAELAIRRAPVVLVAISAAVGPDVVRKLCNLHRGDDTYVIAVIPAEGHASIASMLAAGAHDVLCTPFSSEELIARVDVDRRIRPWQRACLPPPPASPIAGLRACDYLGEIACDELGEMLCTRLGVSIGLSPMPGELRVATIALTLAAEQTELAISVAATPAAQQWLGGVLLGDHSPSPELMRDILRELANTVAGAVKRAAFFEGRIFSTGIPEDGVTLPRPDADVRGWRLALDPWTELAILAEIRRKPNRRVAASRLAEGMVIAGDIRSAAGVLLVSAGTRLTATTAHRLGSMLDAAMIEVAG